MKAVTATLDVGPLSIPGVARFHKALYVMQMAWARGNWVHYSQIDPPGPRRAWGDAAWARWRRELYEAAKEIVDSYERGDWK